MKVLCNRFIGEYSLAQNKPATVEGNRSYIRVHILPAGQKEGSGRQTSLLGFLLFGCGVWESLTRRGGRMEFAMSAGTKLRDDFDAGAALAKASTGAAQTRRLIAVASIYDGGSHLEAARIGGVSPQIVREWIVRFNSRS